MKTLVTCCCALFLFLSSAFAQREADLHVAITSPQSPVAIAPAEYLSLSIRIDNAGEDTIAMADTLALYILFDGDTVPVGIPDQNYIGFPQNLVVPGDSLVIVRNVAFDESFAGSVIEMCVFVRPKNGSHPIPDPDLSDNTDCITITIDESAGMDGETAGIVTIAPNPASDQFTIASQLPVSAVRAADASGKILPATMTDTQTIDCSTWAPGMYVLTVETTAGAVVKRVVVR